MLDKILIIFIIFIKTINNDLVCLYRSVIEERNIFAGGGWYGSHSLWTRWECLWEGSRFKGEFSYEKGLSFQRQLSGKSILVFHRICRNPRGKDPVFHQAAGLAVVGGFVHPLSDRIFYRDSCRQRIDCAFPFDSRRGKRGGGLAVFPVWLIDRKQN